MSKIIPLYPSSNSLTRATIKVHGLVQGVSFRFETQRLARELGLKGWVRNEDNSSVLIVAEGEKEKLEKLITWCHQGPSGAQVEKVEVTWEEAKGIFENFSLKW